MKRFIGTRHSDLLRRENKSASEVRHDCSGEEGKESNVCQ